MLQQYRNEGRQDQQRKEDKEEKDRSTYVARVKAHLMECTVAPSQPVAKTYDGIVVNIPFLSRPDRTEILTILNNGDVSIIVGPSNSGKTTGVLDALQHRGSSKQDGSSKQVGASKPSNGVVYLSLRENASYEVPDKLGEAVGYTREEGRETKLQHVLDVTKKALEEMKKESVNPPIFIIDDVHEPFEDGKFPPGIKHLLSWLLEMHSRGLLLFKMLSSETHIVPHIQTAISGMSARGSPAAINYVESGAVKKYLKEHLKDLSDPEIDRVVDVVGGHLGDVGRIVAEMTFGVPPNVTPTAYLEVALRRIIAKDAVRMTRLAVGKINEEKRVVSGKIDDETKEKTSVVIVDINGLPISTCELSQLVRKLFTLLEISREVAVSDLIEQSKLVDDVVDAVVDLLVDRNILRYTEEEDCVAFHSPHQRYTWLMVKEKERVKQKAQLCGV